MYLTFLGFDKIVFTAQRRELIAREMLNGGGDDGWHEVSEVIPSVDTPVKFELQQHLNFIGFSKSGKCFLGSSDLADRTHTGRIWLFSELVLPLESEKRLARHNCASPVTVGAFLSEDLVVVAEDTGLVVTYQFNKTDELHFVPNSYLTPHDSWINSLSVCPGADEVITGGADARICVLDNKGSSLKVNYHPAHGTAVSSVAASINDSSVFASSSMDRTALLWDTRLPKPAKVLMVGECGYTALAWKDEHHIAIASESGMVHIHDVRSKSSIRDIPLQKTAIRKLAFSKSGLLASCSDSVEVRLWNFETDKMIFPDPQHENFVSDVAWETNKLYSCGYDGQVYSYPLS